MPFPFQDWAELLLRMYSRWAEARGFSCRVVERSDGDEAGIKSAMLDIEGRYAHGYLAGEKGTHRLVRISPFGGGKALRQVSKSWGLLSESSLRLQRT